MRYTLQRASNFFGKAESPELKLSSSAARLKTWGKTHQIDALLKRMYCNPDSCLHHGFVREHRASFCMHISAVMKAGLRTEHESFVEVLKSESALLNEEQTERYLLNPYIESGNFNPTEGHHPEKGKYTPKNRLEKNPEKYVEWKRRNKASPEHGYGGISNDSTDDLTSVIRQYLQAKTSVASTSVLGPTNTTNVSAKRRVITFKCKNDASSSDSILIDGNSLTDESTMEEVLTFSEDGFPSYNDENHLEIDDPNGSAQFFYVKVQNGNEDFIFRKRRFLKMTVEDVYSHECVNIPITITIE